MTASHWSASTAVECDAEPYMLSLFIADEQMNGERMTPVLDPHKLEARLRAATSDLEALHGNGEKKGKKGSLFALLGSVQEELTWTCRSIFWSTFSAKQ